MDLNKLTAEELQGYLDTVNRDIRANETLLAAQRARDDLIRFSELMMPDPEHHDNSNYSRYDAQRHHRTIAAALEEVEKGHILRLIISMPPRHGKSQLVSRMFPAWFMGKDPYRSIIFATYNSEFALDFGRETRVVMQSDLYRTMFPASTLRQGSQAAERLVMDDGGMYVAVGRGGALTGRGADVLVIDDPIKDADEANSPTIRNKLWDWYTKVALTRLMTGAGRVVIVMTRWHEDDLVGRLTNPENPYYVEEEAAQWHVLDLPAIAREDDPMDRQPGEALWPSRFDLDYLEQMRRVDPKGFSALYQGRPSPEEGDFFRAEWIDRNAYKRGELPANLRYYCASDHAVSQEQDRDATVLLPVGVDDDGDIWVLPEVWWQRQQTDAVVKGMIGLMMRYPFLMWWAERGHITKSIGPFLRKRMIEEGASVAIDEVVPSADKQTRAQAIQARMSMGRVHFPKFAPWFTEARSQLLKFPTGANDDFVDALAYIGLGLSKQVKASGPIRKKNTPKTGTLAWLKHETALQEREQKVNNVRPGW